MNAPARYIDRGPYEPIHEQMVFLPGRVTAIGNTTIKPGVDWVIHNAPIGFDAEANLESVIAGLQAREPSDPETLAAAEAALGRVRSNQNESPDEWSTKLANDLAAIRD